MRRAASRRSSSVRIVTPVRASASGTFGVTRNARRKSSDFIAASASSSSSRSPLLAIITGSTTSQGTSRSSTAAATASTIAAFASMPVLAAWAPKSDITASIWAVTRSADSASNERTPSEFCAVTAVMALVPYKPCAANVLRSAWIPAPPPESLPAIVSAIRMSVRLVVLVGAIGLTRVGAAQEAPDGWKDGGCGEQFHEIGHHERNHAGDERRLQANWRRLGGRAREEAEP